MDYVLLNNKTYIEKEGMYFVFTERKCLSSFTVFTFQIRKEDKSEVEQNIRDALESICTPDDVERELRAALTSLNLDSKEDQL